MSAEVDDGDAIAAVAQRWRVKPGTLSWWRWQLRHASPSKPSFVPVVAKPVVRESASVEVHVDGVKLVVEAGTDVRYVSDLVAALRAC